MKHLPLATAAAAIVVSAVLALAMQPSPAARADVARPLNFVSSAACEHGGRVQATFLIPDAARLAASAGHVEQIWIDLSLQDNGFAPGTFIATGPHFAQEGQRTTFEWSGLAPGLRHYYRLNMLIDGQWRRYSQEGASFDTPNCVDILRLDCDEQSLTNSVLFASAPPPRFGPTEHDRHEPASKWVDISMQDNGFAPGTFVGLEFPKDDYLVQWHGILSAAQHYYRVNWYFPLAAPAWREQTRGAIATLNCYELPHPR